MENTKPIWSVYGYGINFFLNFLKSKPHFDFYSKVLSNLQKKQKFAENTKTCIKFSEYAEICKKMQKSAENVES